MKNPDVPPHSLGKLIEWKHADQHVQNHGGGNSVTPHSLGKLIEWKPTLSLVPSGFSTVSPHSLGKLIEWKLAIADYVV